MCAGQGEVRFLAIWMLLIGILFYSPIVWAQDVGMVEAPLFGATAIGGPEDPLTVAVDEIGELQEREGSLKERLEGFAEEVRPFEEEEVLLSRIVDRLGQRESADLALAEVYAAELLIGQVERALNRAWRSIWFASAQEVLAELEEVRERKRELVAMRDEALGEANARRLADAERVQAEARQAIEESRRQEEQERSAQIRRLLAQERAYAEELLEVVEQESAQIRELVQDRRRRAELYAVRRASIQDALESGVLAAHDEAIEQAIEYRRQAREGLQRSRQELSLARQGVVEAERLLVSAEKDRRALEAELGAALETSELARRRLQVAQAKVEVAARRFSAAQGVLEAKEEHHRVFEERARFYHRIVVESFDEISPLLRREILDPRQELGWRDTMAGAQELGERISAHFKGRREGLKGLSAQVGTIDFWGLVISIIWRLMVAFGAIWFIRRDGPRIFHGLIRFLLRRVFFQRRAAGLIKFAEVVRALLIPLVLYGSAKWLLVFLRPIFIEALYIEWAIDIIAIYWLVMAAVRVLVLRRDQRESASAGPAPDLGDLTGNQDALDAFIKATGLEHWRGERVVRAVRLILVVWLVMIFLPRLVWAAFGPSPLWFVVQQATVLGLVVSSYIVLSWWKEDMAAVFVSLAGERMPRAVEAVQRHQERIYGVILIAVVSLFVVLREGARRGRAWLVEREWNRQLANFIFRKKIEIQQRSRDNQDEEELGQSSRVPRRYQELFKSQALWDEPYLVSRTEPVRRVVEHHQKWRAQRRKGAVAVVGEAGLGKTTLLNQLVREDCFEGSGVQYLTLFEKQTRRREVVSFLGELFGLDVGPEWELSRLVEAIREATPRVLIVDDCHQLFMRHIGGFRGLDAFLDVVHMTSDRHFWVLAFNHFPWTYLNRVEPREHLFGEVLHLPPWTEVEIEELIRGRDRTSDLAISFTDLVVTHESKERYYEVIKTSRGYFRLLHEYSQGNPSVAQAYWLRSLRMDEHRRLQVGLFQRPAAETFGNLADQYLFALAAIAQHGVLSADEIARVISAERSFCARALNYLRENDIVEIQAGTGRARIRKDYLRLVMRHLSGSNFLYE